MPVHTGHPATSPWSLELAGAPHSLGDSEVPHIRGRMSGPDMQPRPRRAPRGCGGQSGKGLHLLHPACEDAFRAQGQHSLGRQGLESRVPQGAAGQLGCGGGLTSGTPNTHTHHIHTHTHTHLHTHTYTFAPITSSTSPTLTHTHIHILKHFGRLNCTLKIHVHPESDVEINSSQR